jgi:hypothetical protein
MVQNAQRQDMANDFTYADVGNYGLGHSLLAWARCRLWSRQRDLPMLAPSWLRLRGRIGPLIRGERDSRQYHRLFHFPGYVTGARRLWLLSTLERVTPAKFEPQGDGRLVMFTNLMSQNEETHFREIIGHGPQVRAELAAMTRPQYLPPVPANQPIGLHLRMGDFSPAISIEALKAGAKNSRIPVEWYCGILQALRSRLGDLPALVFSDGTDESLAPLLALADVRRAPKQPSVTDLLSIAQCRVLVSSGSGFSMWGTFLGDIPRVCFPGQRFVRVLESLEVDREPECMTGEDLSDDFVRYLRHGAGS